MPELPEVETIKRAVAKGIGCCKIKNTYIYNRNLRQKILADLEENIINTRITGYKRIAKYIVMDLNNGLSLLWHMGMSGTMRICEKIPVIEKHDHVVIETSNGVLVYNRISERVVRFIDYDGPEMVLAESCKPFFCSESLHGADCNTLIGC